jgi:hypothetical protein
MTHESNLLQPKLALAQLVVQLMVLKLLPCQMEMFFVFFFILRVDQYILDEQYNELA